MMVLIACIVIAFTALQFLVALANLIFESDLPEEGEKEGPLVSVLIPARNEEKNIGNIIEDLLGQDYQHIEIVVFNDQSSDRTEEVVRTYAVRDERIRLINSTGLPAGWTGKNYACHSLALNAKGEYFLFLDADVRISGNVIGRCLALVRKKGLDLVSVFPKQEMQTPGEKITVPIINYVLVTLLPLVLVEKSRHSSLAAASGAFMFFTAGAYREVLPHEKVKRAVVEDVSIARLFKKADKRVACLLGDDDYSCRMYHGFRHAVGGFSKFITTFFADSFVLSVLFFLVTTFGFLPVLWAMPSWVFAGYLVVYVLTRVIVFFLSHQNILSSVLLSIPVQLSLGLINCMAYLSRFSGKLEWKGRQIA